jgi:4-amino-4-deoxy-L-arabinose transferase-like glycosyltransferase
LRAQAADRSPARCSSLIAAEWTTSLRPVRAPATRRFLALLGVILAVAFGVRVVYVLAVAQNDEKFYDAAYYELQARAIVDGRGYVDPFQFLPGHPHQSTPAADHPPLTVFALVPVAAVGDALGLDDEDSQLAMRFEVALVGLAAVGVIGLLGRELAGNRVGLIAAAIAAVYPYLWVNDGLIMSEAFATFFVTAALLLVLRLLRRPSLGLALGLGVLCGLAALSRAELLLLAPLLGLPLLMSFRALPWSRRLAIVGTLAAGTVIIVGPWVAYNLSRFDDPTLLSTNDGTAMLASNCHSVFFGPATGLTDLGQCIPKHPPAGDQSVVSRIYRSQAFDYMKDHKARTPVVVLARIGRDWGLYRPGDMLSWNVQEGRPRWITGLGMVFYYPLLLLAIAGVVLLERRGKRQWPILMPPLIVTVGTVLSYGQTRFRVPAEPSLVVLAAVTLAALSVRLWPSPRGRSDGSGADEAPTDQTLASSTIAASSSS